MLKLPFQCLLDIASTLVSLSTIPRIMLVFCDNIYYGILWSKSYIYECVCPDCSIRGIILIVMGALVGLFCLLNLLLISWEHRRWSSLALSLFWATG
ncbi:hypothetical protein C7974DRAFT_395198, partial [Boeremia exigua]|uniref:uncharacterized protein n=1 Tax=Boeremia exigua TaxID=749465 RepID=UPI001E8CE53A